MSRKKAPKYTFERDVDQLGRVTLPVECRRSLGIEAHTPVRMRFYGTFVVLMREDEECSPKLIPMLDAVNAFPPDLQPTILSLIDYTVSKNIPQSNL